MIHAYPLSLGAVTGALALALWSYRKLPRVTAWLFGIAAFTITVAVTPWMDALAGLTAAGPGLTILTGIVLIGALGFWLEAIVKHKHHRIRTPVIAGAFGVALVLAIADGAELLSNAGKTTSKTGSAFSADMLRIQDGKAARAVAPDHRMLILALGIGVIIALVVLALKFERGKKGTSRPGIAAPRRPALALKRGR